MPAGGRAVRRVGGRASGWTGGRAGGRACDDGWSARCVVVVRVCAACPMGWGEARGLALLAVLIPLLYLFLVSLSCFFFAWASGA